MHIVVNLDVMLARRKMSSNELASKIGITPANAVNTTKRIKNDMVKPELKPCITAKSIKINIDAKKTSKQF